MPNQPSPIALSVFTDQPVWKDCPYGVEGGIDVTKLPKGSVTSKTGVVSFSNESRRVFVPLNEISIVVGEPVHTVYGNNRRRRYDDSAVNIVIVNQPPFPKAERENSVFESDEIYWTYNCTTETTAHGYLRKVRDVGFRVPDAFYRDSKAMAKLLSWSDAGKTIYAFSPHRGLLPFSSFPLGALTGSFQNYLRDRGDYSNNLTPVSISECLQDSAFWVKVCKNKDALALLSLLSIEGGNRNTQELIVETLVTHKLLS